VHDEIVVMVKEEIQEEARAFVEKSMLDAERLYVKNIEPAVKSTISKYWSK
jgi:DNA polymerase I-like protein with 3'-5' exonuclease and polymerase domains